LTRPTPPDFITRFRNKIEPPLTSSITAAAC
jgi:hypothetical protein